MMQRSPWSLSLISVIQSVVHDKPTPDNNPNPILFCGAVMLTNLQNSKTQSLVHRHYGLNSEALVYPALVFLIINYFFHNTGS